MTRSKKILLFAAVVLCFFAMAAWAAGSYAATLTGGSTGATVTEIQRRLKSWGYYEGEIDGKYGQQTIDAVKYFQQKNGLPQTGTVDDATAEKIGVSLTGWTPSGGGSGSTDASSGDLYLLACCIYGEARGEPYKGQVAVGAVVLNRVKSASFPNTIAGVIYQPGAFSCVDDGQINLTPDETAMNAARDAMNGWDPTGGCVFYYNPEKTSNSFMHSLETVVTIGDHRFARES